VTRDGRRRRLRRQDAERLLATGHGDDQAALSRLVAAARAPGRPDELAREDGAVAAFRAARAQPGSGTLRRVAARAMVIKVGVVVAVTAAAGVAVAAVTDNLPGQVDSPQPQTPVDVTTPARPGGRATDRTPSPPPTDTTAPSATPTTSLTSGPSFGPSSGPSSGPSGGPTPSATAGPSKKPKKVPPGQAKKTPPPPPAPPPTGGRRH
jgi:hypothetical protein